MRPMFFAMFGAITLLACGGAPMQAPEPPLGLWVWNANQPENRLDMRIEKVDGGWRAQVQSAPAEIHVNEATISVEGPDGHRFTGELSADRSRISGRWRQPANEFGYSDMATLVTFPAVGNDRWGGVVTLQARPFRIFLDVFEDNAGKLAAVIRNPERNEIMRATRFRIEQVSANQWELVAGSGKRQIRQSLSLAGDELQLSHNWFAEALTMRPATSADHTGYFPRDPEHGRDTYAPPPQRDDGWSVAGAEEAGFDRAALDTLVGEISKSDPRSAHPRLVHALLVAHKGALVMEEYFYGYDRETPHDTRSLGKVFAPVLIGALKHQGFAIDAGDRPIPRILSAAGERPDDPRKAAITLAQLMSFSSGLDCDDNRNSPGAEDRLWSQQDEDDFWRYTARLPVLHDPGTRYAYCSASINLVGARLREIGGEPINDLFEEFIAKPLGFGRYHWNLTPNGAAYLGGGPYMRPRDILKIGAMHAAGGRWNGRQVLDPSWVEESTTTVIEITPQTTGTTPEVFNNSYAGGGAAYEWGVDNLQVGGRTYRSYAASGNGGQILVVIPELELTVLMMGGNYRQYGIWGRWRDELIGGHIIPAIAGDAKP